MQSLFKYFSTAPVLLIIWLSVTSTFIMLINYYYPDYLSFPTF